MKQRGKRNIEINPERFQMAWCPSCRGTGRSTDGEKEIGVCLRCGGFGWIKIEKDIRKK